MATGNRKPTINPILSFLEKPTPKGITGGGKNATGINWSRLDAQKKVLSENLNSIQNDKEIISHSGKIHLLVKMFDDSLAPSWTPNDLFETNTLTRIVSPAYKGFLVETSKEKLKDIVKRITSAQTDKIKVDISRLKSIKGFGKEEVLRNKNQSDSFNESSTLENQFNVWLLPFHDSNARISVVNDLKSLVKDGTLSFGDHKFMDVFDEKKNFSSDSSFIKKLDRYLAEGYLSFTTVLKTRNDFQKLISSGAIYRIEPVKSITTKSSPPGSGKEPSPQLIDKENAPVVVIIDGGCSAASYTPFNVMKIKPLISEYDADLKHGNRVTSIICQASGWNNNLSLPNIDCKFISVQAINKIGVKIQPTTEQFVSYLRTVAEKTKGIASVWNLSFNESSPSVNFEEISYLGHEINGIAREFNILPVISIGNIDDSNKSRLCPPADCESALTIAGRIANDNGDVHLACPQSLRGPAPAGMKKPELSWFSRLRMIGGDIHVGTSFSAPLISSIAAHTFKNIKNPTPDLVKALLINKAEEIEHDLRIGWGTPWHKGNAMPWLCDDGTVTLAWNSKLKAGNSYYWNDIPLPSEMIINGKIKGDIILTAILKPIVSELGGDNYFATRLQCSLQHISEQGKIKSLLGSMRESTEKEIDSRQELAKWSPVRHHGKSFKGVAVDNEKVRLYARIFTRDLYQFGYSSHHELDEQDVSFVLTFKSHGKDPAIYNSMTQRLGNKVEVASIEQDIHLDNLT
ncbi:S8 family serine peptidase [Nissabacter archeti]|uniref:S8 family serine peptidase n=1 Tax=Nissabacter archeti TaxID=1917880 RepID=A0ABS5JGV8_9GAMM|nr:S8 family serine peptidase [Nissabacter archeti]MBS0969132.1 S8 family serine peptidase [Nissabacter archeti]